jgi:hypothetical protein
MPVKVVTGNKMPVKVVAGFSIRIPIMLFIMLFRVGCAVAGMLP